MSQTQLIQRQTFCPIIFFSIIRTFILSKKVLDIFGFFPIWKSDPNILVNVTLRNVWKIISQSIELLILMYYLYRKKKLVSESFFWEVFFSLTSFTSGTVPISSGSEGWWRELFRKAILVGVHLSFSKEILAKNVLQILLKPNYQQNNPLHQV